MDLKGVEKLSDIKSSGLWHFLTESASQDEALRHNLQN